MIVVAIIALLAAIAIPNLLRARVNANESAAQATLKTIATAAESFASANNGNYPTVVTDLTDATPPYMNENYCDAAIRSGYTYTCTFAVDSYNILGAAQNCGTSGTRDYNITTGAVMGAANCT